MPTHNLQQNFNGGALSPRLHGRTDASIYDIALSEMVNFAPTVEGPAIKRSGSIISAEAMPSACNLIPFEFNSRQAYVLEFGDGQLRIYANTGALITDGSGNPVVVTVPYAQADVPLIDWWQDADVMYLAHPSYPYAKLSRTGATSFVYEVITLTGGPFQDQNSDQSITVYSTGDTSVGSVVTLTASSPIFLPGHVGGLFQLQSEDFASFPFGNRVCVRSWATSGGGKGRFTGTSMALRPARHRRPIIRDRPRMDRAARMLRGTSMA
jgi:hypothetical protein